MVSATVAKALEKAAKRAARVAEADAGLGEADPLGSQAKRKVKIWKAQRRHPGQIHKFANITGSISLLQSEWNFDILLLWFDLSTPLSFA